MARHLDGKTALVTGSSRNLGAAIARALAGRGARVIVTFHQSEDAARALAEELRPDWGTDHVVVRGDLSTPSGTAALLDRVLTEVERVDVLVNNAGPFSMEPFAELDVDEWNRIWDANVTATYLATQRLVAGMREQGWGRIVNVSAGSAYIRNHSIYTLAKSALITLTEQLALELAPEITVNAVAPGQLAESAKDIAEFDPTFVERAIDWTPTRRLVRRAEVAEIVAEMCGPLFDSVTGVTIPVDGGWRLPRF